MRVTSERFVSRLFLIAGIGGLSILVPWLLLGGTVGVDYPPAVSDPPAIQRVVLSVGIAAQFVILLISRAPLRFRNLMWAGILEKAGVVAFAMWIIGSGGTLAIWVWPVIAADFLLGISFLIERRALNAVPTA